MPPPDSGGTEPTVELVSDGDLPPRPLRVLCASRTARRTGSAVSLSLFMHGTDRSRVVPIGAFAKRGPVTSELAAAGIPVHILSWGRLGQLGWIIEAVRVLRREKVDVVYLNSAVEFCRAVGIAAKLLRIPMFWYIRENPDGPRVRRLHRWIRWLPQRVVAVSRAVEEGLVWRDDTLCIENGVDPGEFHPEGGRSEFRTRWSIPDHAFVFATVGGVVPEKGTDLFVRAGARVGREAADSHFLIVGDGPRTFEAELKQFIAAHPPLRRQVTMTGRIDDVHRAMAAADVVVVPSVWESFPRVVLEAMASGRPVIASAVGGIPGIVDEGATGWLVPPGDEDALVARMSECMGDPSGLAAFGLTARQRVIREFSLERHVQRVEGVVIELWRGTKTPVRTARRRRGRGRTPVVPPSGSRSGR